MNSGEGAFEPWDEDPRSSVAGERGCKRLPGSLPHPEWTNKPYNNLPNYLIRLPYCVASRRWDALPDPAETTAWDM